MGRYRWAIAFVLGGIISLGCGQSNSAGEKVKLEATTTDGTHFTIDELNGKYVLLDYWGSWCGPCRGEYPRLEKLYTDYHDRGLEVVSIALEKREGHSARFAEQFPWRVQIEDAAKFVILSPFAQQFGVTDLPHKVLIGPDGRMIKNRVSLIEAQDILSKKLESSAKN